MSRRKKLGVRIWVHVLALVLMVSMIMGVGTIEAQAAMMENIVVSNIQYYSSGCLKSFDLSYKVGSGSPWDYAAADARISVQTVEFEDEDLGLARPGKYANEGPGKNYTDWPETPAECGFITWNKNGTFIRPATGNTDSRTIEFNDGVIDLSDQTSKTYYLYIWANYSDYGPRKTYPDAFVTSFTSGNGSITVDAHIHQWEYTAEGNSLKARCVANNKSQDCSYYGAENAVILSVTAQQQDYISDMLVGSYGGASLDKTAWEAAGLEVPTIKYYSDNECTVEMTSTFPSAGTYYAAVAVEGAAAKAEFELTSVNVPVQHVHSVSQDWTKTDTHHWKECAASGCDITEDSGKEAYGSHVWADDSDTDCNTCGHTRTIPGNTNPPANNNNPASNVDTGNTDTGSTDFTIPAAPAVKPAETPVVFSTPVEEEVKVLDELPPMGEVGNTIEAVLFLCSVLSGTALLWSCFVSKRKRA